MKKEIVRYEISKDGIGLLAYFEDGQFYHIHSDELTKLERSILSFLNEHRGGGCGTGKAQKNKEG